MRSVIVLALFLSCVDSTAPPRPIPVTPTVIPPVGPPKADGYIPAQPRDNGPIG